VRHGPKRRERRDGTAAKGAHGQHAARGTYDFAEEEAVLLLGHLQQLGLEHLTRRKVAERLILGRGLPHGLNQRCGLLLVVPSLLERVLGEPTR